MALITKAALQYDMFQTASKISYYEIPPTERQKDLICMYNHHKMIGKTELQNEEVFVGKNGYTDAAGHTLVTCAARDGMVIICVVTRAQGEHIYSDTLELLNYGLDCFSKEKSVRMKYAEVIMNKKKIYFKVAYWIFICAFILTGCSNNHGAEEKISVEDGNKNRWKKK